MGLLPLAVAIATGMPGCTAARSPLDRAIAARGGPLAALARSVEADVQQGFPGTWRWRTVYQAPDRWAWSIETTGEPNHYLFDGAVARAFVGTREVSADASPGAPLRSQARFMSVAGLDALRAPGVVVGPLPPDALPAGATWGMAVRLPDETAEYRVALDAQGRVVSVSGPLAIAPFGLGDVTATFDDYRRVGGAWIAHRVRWSAGGATLAVERVLAACPDPPALGADAFRDPSLLPACPAEGDQRPAGLRR